MDTKFNMINTDTIIKIEEEIWLLNQVISLSSIQV